MCTLIDEDFIALWQAISGGEEGISTGMTGFQTIPRFGELEHFCTWVDTENWMIKTCQN